MSRARFGAILAAVLYLITQLQAQNTNEDQARQFLVDLDKEYVVEANAQMMARWAYITDVSDANSNAQIDANIKFQEFQKNAWNRVRGFDWSGFSSGVTKREFEFLNILGTAALEGEDLKQINQLAADMETVYSTAKICAFNEPASCNLALEPEITEIMATSTDYEELKHVWTEWRNTAGKPIREQYKQFIQLQNKAAQANDAVVYPDMGKLWNAYYLFDGYSEDQFKADIEEIWTTVKPLYEQLYTYVRRILAENVYPGQLQRYGRLPAHVLGNMWAQSWGNIAGHLLPYNADPIDATPEMIAQGYNARTMFDKSEEFFIGLGFERMTSTFWEKSMIEKPTDGREVVCHASAEEFFIGPNSDQREDWRIKMCTAVNQEDFVTVHHEMGHIEYFMRYRDQHWVFRNGANPGFHEAIGDTIALAVSTPAHLEGLGLLKPSKTTATPRFENLPRLPEGVTERDINYLLNQALDKVAFLPFGYLMDKWRWGVFDGTTGDNLNSDWWKLRETLQGLRAPVERSEDDFDPGAKYHIPANVEYIRYFVSFIVQFQFYESMCIAAGQYDPANPMDKPLYQCDFAGNKAAGLKMLNMMDPGFSEPWPQALEAMTGTAKMDASSMLRYFEPLKTWLEEANTLAKDCTGWDDFCESHAADYMKNEYEPEALRLWNLATVAEWNFQTNLTEYNAEQSTLANIQAAAYEETSWKERFTQYEWEYFQDAQLKRQFQLLQVLGTAALPQDKLAEYSKVITSMTNQYSAAKICPYKSKDNCQDNEKISLEPDIESVLASSKDYDELSYVWSEWRKVAAKPMRADYENYVNLSNQAAQANDLNDMSELWVEPYETDNFPEQLEKILNETRPLYEQIHAFTRMKLRGRYGQAKIDSDTPIPASLLGNMWAQDWGNLYSLLTPYPNAVAVDVTDEMIKQGWNAKKMFEVSEEFYTSLGLEPMPTCYGPLSMIEKPTDREVVCHASAWDFLTGDDFRIKMCTNVDMSDLITVHHEQGHIQYDIQYSKQPITFRNGANPGFHEAIGDVMALSVSTPKHLNKIGLLSEFTPSLESDLNFLMKLALEKVVFLPFSYVMDRWRYGVFSGEYEQEKWTYTWHMLTEKYQGLIPPVKRTKDDFDPGAKYHIAADVEYSRYFVAHVLQFQIHKALCLAAGEYDPNDSNKPLYRCDIYQSEAAGSIMKKLLEAGSSRPWRETLLEAIGTDTLDASAILEYFAPLRDYLKTELDKSGEKLGWRTRFEEFMEQEPDPVDNTVPIIVGAVLGALVLIVIVAYFVGRRINKKKEKKRKAADSQKSDVEAGVSMETRPPATNPAEPKKKEVEKPALRTFTAEPIPEEAAPVVTEKPLGRSVEMAPVYEETPAAEPEIHKADPEPASMKAVEPEPAPAPVKAAEPEPAPVKAAEPEPEPIPVKAVEPEPAPVKADEPEPMPVKAAEPEPAPVKAAEPEPAPVKAVEPEAAPVKATEPEPTPVKAPEPEPAPVKTDESEPSAIPSVPPSE